MTIMPRHFLDLDRFDGATLRQILESAKAMKQGRGQRGKGWV